MRLLILVFLYFNPFILLFAADSLQAKSIPTIKSFIESFHENKDKIKLEFYESISDEKVSEEFISQSEKLIDDILEDSIRSYIDEVSSGDHNLLDKWFGQISEIETSNFVKKDQFISYWNQVIRNRLDMHALGNRLNGYLDLLSNEQSQELKAEVKFILQEWENEKQNSSESFERQNFTGNPDGYELVFEKPISTRGSHMKFLYRDLQTGLLFCAVKVGGHGSRRSMPKKEVDRQFQKTIIKNFERKQEYLKPKPEKSKIESQEKTSKAFVPVNDFGSRLYSYQINNFDFSDINLGKNKRDPKGQISSGENYYKKLPDSTRLLIDLEYEKYFFAHKENSWLMQNKIDGKYLYCFKVIEKNEAQLDCKNEDAQPQKKTEVMFNTVYEQVPRVTSRNYRQNHRKEAAWRKKSTEAKQKLADDRAKATRNAQRLIEFLARQQKSHREILDFLNNFLNPQRIFTINYQDEVGYSVILAAVSTGSLEIVKAVVERFKGEIDLNILASDGKTPLNLAASLGALDIFQYLIKEGANLYFMNRQNESALSKAVSSHKKEIVEYIVSIGKDDERFVEFLNTPLSPLAKKYSGFTPLMIAAHLDNSVVTEILVEAKAKTEIIHNNETALSMAIKSSNLVILCLLLKNADPNFVTEDTPLMLLLKRKKEIYPIVFDAMLSALLHKGASPELLGKNGDLPLIYVLDNLKPEAISHFKLMLDFTKNPNLKVDGENLLNYLCSKFIDNISIPMFKVPLTFKFTSVHLNTVQKLQSIRSLVPASHFAYNEFGKLSLEPNHKSAAIFLDESLNNMMVNFYQIIDALLTKGADPLAVSTDGNSVLHMLAERGHLRAVIRLMSFSKLNELKNIQGKSAYELVLQAKIKMKSNFSEYLESLPRYSPDTPEANQCLLEQVANQDRMLILSKSYDDILKLLHIPRLNRS